MSAAFNLNRTVQNEERVYVIKRFRFMDNGGPEIIKRHLTLEEAQAHCRREDTHGNGWFDGYDKEV